MFLNFVATILLCLGVCISARWVGCRLQVLDKPDAVRKRHREPTPMVGGIAVLVPFAVWASVRLLLQNVDDAVFLRALVFCAAGAGIVGFADDQSNTTPLARILALLLLVAIAFALAPQLITPQLVFASAGAQAIGFWPYVFLIAFAAVGLVNAVNMADGQNGLVLGMFAIWSVSLMVACGGVINDVASILLVLLVIVGGFNLYGRLFLGDCGSYGITFLFGLLVAYAHARQRVPLEVITVWFFIPVVDCVRLLISRSIRGISPVSPDRDHFHHRLADRLGKKFGLIVYLTAVGSSSLLVAFDPRFSLACLAALVAFYFCSGWLTEPTRDMIQRDHPEPVSSRG